MENLIMKIIDLEEQAQQVIKDAKEADERLESEIDKEAAELHNFIEEGSRRRCEEKVKAIMWDAQKKCEEIEALAQKNIKELEDKCRENKEKWVDEIFRNITEK